MMFQRLGKSAGFERCSNKSISEGVSALHLGKAWLRRMKYAEARENEKETEGCQATVQAKAEALHFPDWKNSP